MAEAMANPKVCGDVRIQTGWPIMTNIFESVTGIPVPAADRVFATMTDMALWSAQGSGVPPANLQQAEMMIRIHIHKIQNQCYSDGAVIRR